jgi:hypothetical protein
MIGRCGLNLSGSRIQEISRLDEELLASQEGLCLMEVVVLLSIFVTADGSTSLFHRHCKQDRSFTVSSA